MIRFVLLALIVATAGCGGAGHAEFTGQVTHRGKPVYRGSITLIGDDKVPHIAAIGEDGTFRFDNAPTGLVKIGVLCPVPLADDGSTSPELRRKLAATGVTPASKEARKRWFKISERLGDPESSNLTVEIESPATHRQIDLPD